MTGRFEWNAGAAPDLGALDEVARAIRSQPILDLGHALAALGCVDYFDVNVRRLLAPRLGNHFIHQPHRARDRII